MSRAVKKKSPGEKQGIARGTARDVSYFKPEGFEDYLTILELSRRIKRDVSWIRKLEREKRIPVAYRHEAGSLSIRLWSPTQVDEIEQIMKRMRPGRPHG